MNNYEQVVLISYAWGGESEEIVNKIDRSLQNRGIKIIRDKRDLEYKGSIKEFMERIGQGNCVIVVVSDKYLRSPNCIFELVEIAENKQFHDRIFPVVLADANIYDPVKRLDYIKHWEAKRAELAEAIKSVDPANLHGIRDDIDNYDRFRDKISGLTSILKDMNTLTPEMHKDSDFDSLYEAIQERMQSGDSQADSGFQENRPYNYFQAVPTNLSLSFDALMADKIQDFVGRQFVFDALDEFIKNSRSGYFIIRGAPGMGKTTLMAKLVIDRGYIHHFNIASQNIRSPRLFLENICAQLIARYKLSYDTLPLNAGDDSGFLMKCMSEAAANTKDHPIVIAVDSLDESDRRGLAPAVNSLYLPSSLPQGVYVVMTTRHLEDLQLQVMRQKIIDLAPDSIDNISDINAYIANFIKLTTMRTRLEMWRITPESFIEKMGSKSQGNFMYLYYVLPAIAEGRFSNGTLSELPNGLVEYYKRHWREMMDGRENEFKTIIKPIVCILGVAEEPATLDQIAAWTKINLDDVKKYIVLWKEFLTEGPAKHYRIYHVSFQDFLRDEVELREYNTMIVENIRSKIRPRK